MNNNINENIKFTCFDCLLIPRYYFKFKDKKVYICSSCYCSHEFVLELYEFKERIKKNNNKPKCSKCPNEMISKNSFYFCFKCGKYFCPNHQKHCDSLTNIVHDRIVKIINADKICPFHFEKFIYFCDRCQNPVCEKCECVIKPSNEHKIYKNLTSEELKNYKENLNTNQKKYEYISNYINDKNNIFNDIQLEQILKIYKKNNDDIYEFLNLLIQNYENNKNPIMSYNIQTIFIFNDLQNSLNNIEKFSYIKFLLDPFNNFIQGISDNISRYDYLNEDNLNRNNNNSNENINNSSIIQKNLKKTSIENKKY